MSFPIVVDFRPSHVPSGLWQLAFYDRGQEPAG